MTYESMRAAVFLEAQREAIEDLPDVNVIQLFYNCKWEVFIPSNKTACLQEFSLNKYVYNQNISILNLFFS